MGTPPPFPRPNGAFNDFPCKLPHRAAQPSKLSFGNPSSTKSPMRLMTLRAETNNPHFPALRSDPMALSVASRRKQICSSIPEYKNTDGANPLRVFI